MSLSQVHRHDNALSTSQTIGLDDDWRALLVDIGVCVLRIGKRLIGTGGDIVPHHERFSEVLRAFQLGCRSSGAENPQTGGPKSVDHPRSERRFGTYDRVSDFLPSGKLDQFLDLCEGYILRAVFQCRAAVSRCYEDACYALGLGEAPRQGVFTAP